MKFKTLGRQDKEFRSHLLGTFSKTERAVPVRSLNVGTHQEQIVFQVTSVAEIVEPGFLKKWAEVFKVHHLIWVMMPAFLILSKAVMDQVPTEPLLGFLAIIGVIFLHTGANLYNDYVDHVSGLDRIQAVESLKPLQKGWVTAAETRFWAFFFLFGGLGAGALPFFMNLQLLTWVVVLAAGALALGFYSWQGAKYRWGAEFVGFCLFGPLLTVGLQVALTGHWDLEAVLIGWLMGWLVVEMIHLKNFENIMATEQHGFKNSVAYLGFEKAKKLIAGVWILFCLQFLAFHFFYTPTRFSWIAVIPVLLSFPFLKHLSRLTTPAGSHIRSVVKLGRIALAVTLLFWFLINVIFILMVENP